MVRSSPFFTFTFWAKSFIILAATFAIVITIFCFTLLNVKPNLLRGLICLVTLVFLFVMLLAWKLLTTSSKRNARPPNQVLVRALGYDFSHFQPPSLPVRPPPMRSQVPFTIPRPHIVTDSYGPPARLAPPPPTYDQSNADIEAAASSTAPPIYSENGVLRRTSTASPPPMYRYATEEVNSPPPRRSPHFIIDCMKAEPALFSITGAESVI